MGLLDGKRIVITGVLTDASLAYGVAELAQKEGAEIVLTGAGRGLRLTARTARKLPVEPEVLEFDVTESDEEEGNPRKDCRYHQEARGYDPGRPRPGRSFMMSLVVAVAIAVRTVPMITVVATVVFACLATWMRAIQSPGVRRDLFQGMDEVRNFLDTFRRFWASS